MTKPSSSKLLRRKMHRQAIGDWKQFLAIVLMGAIAMTLFVGLLSNAQSLSERVNAFYAASDTPDVWVVTNNYQSEDEQYIKSLLDEADQFDKRFQITARLESANSYCVVNDGMPRLSHPVNVVAKDETLADDDYFYIDNGLWAGNEIPAEFKLDLGSEAKITFAFADFVKLQDNVMSFLDLYVKKDGGVAIHRQAEVSISSKVNGIMTFGENIQQASYYPSTFLMSKKRFVNAIDSMLRANYTEPGVSMIEAALGNDIPPMNEYLIKFKDSGKADSFEKQVRAYFDAKNTAKPGSSNLIEVLDRQLNPWSIAAETEVQEATQLTFVFPIVFFFVALLVILTTASQIIIKERTQIGTLKAIGLSKREVYLHYLSLIFSLTTLSTIIGFVVGPLLIPFIMARKYNILYTLPARNLFVFPFWQAILAYVVFVGLALLVAFLSCRKEVKLSPVDSMRAKPIEYHSIGKIRSQKPKSPGVLSLKMALRNIVVSKYKSLMVVIGVLGCTALLVCGFGIDDTLDHSVSNDIGMFYDADLHCTYALNSKEETPEFASNPYVKSYDQYFEDQIKITSEDASMATRIYLYHPDHPFVHLDIPEGQVAISGKVSNEMHLGLGDEVSFIYLNHVYTGKVGLIYDSFMLNGIMAHQSTFPAIEGYAGFWVDAVDGVDAATLKQAILEDLGKDKVDKCRTKKETEEMISSVMSGIALMTSAVKVFAIALAVVVLYNLALLNFRERSRDIATMKVLGFSLKEIAYSLIFETLSLTLLGVIFGSLVGYPFMYLVLYVNRVAMVEFLYFISWKTYVISFLLTFVVSFLVNLYLAILTRKVKMVESLKSVE